MRYTSSSSSSFENRSSRSLRRKREINTYEEKYKIISNKRNICKERKNENKINLLHFCMRSKGVNRILYVHAIVKGLHVFFWKGSNKKETQLLFYNYFAIC